MRSNKPAGNARSPKATHMVDDRSQLELHSDEERAGVRLEIEPAGLARADLGRAMHASLPGISNEGLAPAQRPYVWVKLSPAVPTAVYDAYWAFAGERQEIFFRRLAGEPGPWTDDPILRQYKFTNAYRASDRVSQFLIRNVIYDGPSDRDEVVFRILLFKFFNKIETWQLLQSRIGKLTYRDYSYADYELVLSEAMAAGKRIYSAAYIMPAGPRTADGTADRKHRHHLRLLEQMMSDSLPAQLSALDSMRAAFELLRSYASIGDFLAYQFVTDINYSDVTTFSENDFVVPGPGALDGIRKCFATLGGLNESEMIRFIMERQAMEFERRGVPFRTLWGRPLQLIDCQNLFCEISKYSRVAHPTIQGTTGRTRIKQQFSPTPGRLTVWYPPKWGINDAIMGSSNASAAAATRHGNDKR